MFEILDFIISFTIFVLSTSCHSFLIRTTTQSLHSNIPIFFFTTKLILQSEIMYKNKHTLLFIAPVTTAITACLKQT